MTIKLTDTILLGLTGITFLVSIFLFPSLPEHFTSHWNTLGQANGSMSKFWGTFLVPFLMCGFYLIRFLILRADPFKQQLESLRRYHDGFWIMLFFFFVYVDSLILSWNLGHRFNFTFMLIPALSLFFYGIGIVLEKSKRNWFMGIRTPWTLSSDIVWDKTHALGGKLFKIAAALSCTSLLFHNEIVMVALLVVPLFAASLVSVFYSYREYTKLPQSVLRDERKD